MAQSTPVSRCTEGGLLTFYWYGGPSQPNWSALDAATVAFANVMNPPGRLWNIYTWADAKAIFRSRVEDAMRGELEPVDEVKDLQRRGAEFIFEIRWSIDVRDRRNDGLDVIGTSEVRLYHGEPARFPTIFVGLHVHEKQIVSDDEQATSDLQDAEIDKAIDRYETGDPHDWGI